MRADTRALVRVRYKERCGYCDVHENETGALLTVDHFQPISRGGTEDFDNLVYACHACNAFKVVSLVGGDAGADWGCALVADSEEVSGFSGKGNAEHFHILHFSGKAERWIWQKRELLPY